MQPDSPLFALPSEIRDRIYDFYLAYHHSDFVDTLRPKQLFFDDTALFARDLPALMCTCKRAYQELSPAVHGEAAMRVEMRGRVERRIGFAVHGTLRFERLQKLWVLVSMEHPNWNGWLYVFEDIVRRAPHLQVLVVDWAPRSTPESNWEGRANVKKEDEFCDMIKRLKKLRTLKVHGNISARWIERLGDAGPRVILDRSRWWREPGLDS
ncbi:hypothetical protein F5B22DRAFT_289870 [Xylaria bambusicola]|uniref:uncharacterized protein n=1 Tax=Xylaria bambusicola TaxID=326684 RepID=UPI002008439E|nr:uncharacterized protein F5B22DRAFT_289870 [Xylaria bambusicola]KAI0512928.1 hypothetical protein F5B22DRAFT_289870 [Xylaria bambusicola]